MISSWYFAAQYARLPEIACLAKRAEQAGLTITSRWLAQDPGIPYAGDSDEVDGANFAERDLEDVLVADGLLFFAEDSQANVPRGGRHVEFGFALALAKTMEVIGPKENIFHLLSDVRHFETFEEWLASKIKEAE